MSTADVGTALQESLDTLQLSGSGSRIVQLLISSSAVSCVTADGLSVKVKLAHENGCRELARYLLGRLDPKMLCVTIHLQDQGESSWVDQMLGQRNVVELRARGGTLNSTRALVDCLALFDKETVAEEAEEGPDNLELPTNVTLPWHSLQTLISEAVEVDLPQLLRMATTRVNNLQDVPSQLQRVTLINCGTGNSPNLSSMFRAVGVDLQLR
ncbi:hypothetical protein FRC04_005377 [Tulasnella sp. 424]|nr:hypothetical protein FRC04_005377 [Tulasnella sp. 424]KAG8976483.1 hypothetical protein FRC05_003726 [Tulasnella sp. 425]